MSERPGRLAAAAGRMMLAIVAGVLWQSVLWLDAVPAATKAGLCLLVLLSVVRPASVLMVVTACVAISPTLGGLVGLPAHRAGECLVLAFLTGWGIRWAVAPIDGGSGAPGRQAVLERAIVTFAMIVAASLVVMTTLIQPFVGPGTSFVPVMLRLIATEYFRGEPFELHNWYQGALLLEGVALVLVVGALARVGRDYRLALVRLVLWGGIAGASLSMFRLLQLTIRASDVGVLLTRAFSEFRLSYHMADFNAAGSHFVMVLPLLWLFAWRAWRSESSRLVASAWTAACVLVGIALWITGSRAAQFSLLLVAGAGGAVSVGRKRLAVAATIAALVVAAILLIILARPRPESSVVATLGFRWLFTQMSLEMWTTAPIFGIGIAEYYPRSAALMPQALRALYVAENAHNNFLQIGVELGVIGLLAFLGVLSAAGAAIIRGLRAAQSDAVLAGAGVGLSCAILTFLTGHPLLVGAFAYTFWILLGVAVAHANVVRTDASRMPLPARAARMARWIPAAAALVLMVSVPIRAHELRGQLNLSSVRYGLDVGGVDPVSGHSFDYAGPVVTVFVPRDARRLSITMSEVAPDEPVVVDVRVDGVLANRIWLNQGVWQDVRMLLPVSRTERAYRRVDLSVSDPKTSGESGADSATRPSIRCRISWLQAH